MRLTAVLFLSLDGVYQAPGGPSEDVAGGFAHGGWMVPFIGEDFGPPVDEWFAHASAFLLGRRTYDIFAAHWPRVGNVDPVSTALNEKPKYVVTSDPAPLTWANAVKLRAPVVEAVRELKSRGDGELQVHGSGQLLRTLLEAGLVDRLRLFTTPVVLGRGKRLFGPEWSGSFELLDSTRLRSGIEIATYRPKGPVQTGSFELPG